MANSADAGDERGCPKCGETETDVVSLSANDGLVSKMVDLPEDGFTAVSCVFCGYAELYREADSGTDSPQDLFLG
ncbi:nucleic acid-binding protein [Halobacteriales archaeon QH_8_64_26]|jgi:predicted nucleic-acid-binding Zn-ribbon protein|nr:MAG: nucleic acid-binding protein [Halobacteriales archaeon QH_8_64_26]